MTMSFKLLLISFALSAVIVTGKLAENDDVEDSNDARDESHPEREREHSGEYGYSFHKFSGPVSGEIKPIYVPDGHDGKQRLDYFANPDYSYSYGVKDPKTGNSQGHQESRQGDAVHGQYTVLQSDGATRVVKYTADPKNGFQATVEYI